MNPEHLLQNFDRLIDTPDAVPRLRRFILDLAVRGKLVEQNPEDEPAGELLRRIEKEKESLIKAGEMREQKTRTVDKEEIPFTIPEEWAWTQLAQIGIINPRIVAKDRAEASFVPMPMIFSEYGRANQHEIRLWTDIKKGFTQFAEGDVGLAKITPCFENGKSTIFRNLTGGIGAGTTELHIIRPVLIIPEYVLIFLKSPYFIDTGIPKMTGTAGQKRVSKDYFSCSPFPLPPLAEQHRIVAKVDELMKLCDELEATQAKRERRRDRLVAATLHGLNNGDQPGNVSFPLVGNPSEERRRTSRSDLSFLDSARFYFNHLPRLTTRPEHIQQLRQTILNLAVRGKLVEQEPVARSSPRVNGDNRDRPFSIPDFWQWAILREVSKRIHYGYTASANRQKSNIRLLRITDIQDNRVDWNSVPGCDIDESSVVQYELAPRDILIARTGGTIGKTFLVEEVPVRAIFASYLIRVVPDDGVSEYYLKRFMESPLYWNQLYEESKGTGQPNVNSKSLGNLIIPLPPVAEQQRIVAKVDELMALCDEMETRITANTTTSRKLLEAALQEAIAGNMCCNMGSGLTIDF